MKKITKATARKLYNNNTTVFIMNSKLRLVNAWETAMAISASRCQSEFDILVNSFEYFNGKAAYYVVE